MKQYNNALTADTVANFAKSPFTSEEIAAMNDDARAVIAEQEAFKRNHPVTAIYRIATAGSLTRLGGMVKEAHHNSKIQLKNGTKASIALKGDIVEYSDGTTAHIVTSSGKSKTYNGIGIAVVGSKLDNGDEIISTPQESVVFAVYKDVPVAEDFLADGATA